MADAIVAPGARTLQWREVYKFCLLVAVLVAAILSLPNAIWDGANGAFLLAFGGIAAWRYLWWTTHLIRAQIYAHVVFPRLRRRADVLWSSGWRPRFLHFMVITFREKPETTERVLDSIVDECRRTRIPARIFFGTGDISDETVVENYFARQHIDVPLEVVIVRQNQPGKRLAIGVVLRAISRYGVEKDDLVLFMDGDSILGSRVVEACAPLFELNPKLGAVTTNEVAVVLGPEWMQAWHDMRFAQRRLAMQSHSLSKKVLTLTGRLSIFRAGNVVGEDFIRTIEADCLSHWLWGDFRFLSGDDKSTWYWLLSNGWQMLYVPDAFGLTVETISGNPYERVKQNLLRWSGNMLRNGSRALTLGPRRCGFFIWWCLVDQRLSIWTMLTGPVAALALAFTLGPQILIAYLVWVLATRVLLSLVLFCYGRCVYACLPLLLYANQLLSSGLKIYLLFRISRQRWVNRGDQRAGGAQGGLFQLQNAMAGFLTVLYVAVLVFAISVAAGVISIPDWRWLSVRLAGI